MRRAVQSFLFVCTAGLALFGANRSSAEEVSLRALQDAVLAKPYRVQLAVAVQGIAPFTYAIGGDVKPACLAIDPQSGVLHGTPTRACLGNHRIHIVVTDYEGRQTADDFLLHITDGSLMPSPSRQTALAAGSAPTPPPASKPRQPIAKNESNAAVPPPADARSQATTTKTAIESSDDAVRLAQAVGSLHRTAYVKPPAASARRLAAAAKNAGMAALPTGCAWTKDDDPSKASTVIAACETPAQNALNNAGADYKKFASTSDPKAEDRKNTLRPGLLALRDASDDAADSLKGIEVPSMPSSVKEQFDERISYWRQLNGWLEADQADIDAGNDIGDPTSSFHPMPWYIEHAESFGIVGTSLTAATGIATSAKLFAELYGDVPVIIKDYYGLRAWGYARIGGIAQTNATLSSTALNQSITQALGTSSQSFVQSGEFSGGIAIRLPPSQKAEGPNLSFIVGAGAITPLSAPSTQGTLPYYITPEIYNYYTQTMYSTLYSPQLTKICGGVSSTLTKTTNTCFAAFYPQDRSRFFRQYEAGLRLKIPLNAVIPGTVHFPATFDATVGQNEYVTGGKFNGAVVHIGGAAPLIYAPGLYAFGGLDLGVYGPGDKPSPLLLPTPSGATASAANTINIQLPQPNRDRYTLGVGFDLLKVIQDRSKKAAH